MLTEFENKVADFAKANGLFGSSTKVLLTVSGGADSTALMYVMQSLKSRNVLGAELLCAHINHQLRGAEAELDEGFVVEEAAKSKLAVITRRVDVRGYAHRNKLSIETAARKLRIESLLDIAKANDCQVIATAHQKNDNAETVLQRLVRGTGFRGLGGIWPKRVFAGINFVRPFLCVSRDEIIVYLKKQNLKWREDHTNVDCSYRRNFIRHYLIPALQKQCRSSLVEQLFDLSDAAQRFYSLVCNETEKVWQGLAKVSGETAILNLNNFLAQPQAVKVELVRRSLTAVGSGERNLTHQHYESVLQLAEQACPEQIYTERIRLELSRKSRRDVVGRKIELPDGFVVECEYESLIFTRSEENSATDELIGKTIKLEVPGQTQFGQYSIEATIPDVGCLMLDARKRVKSRIETCPERSRRNRESGIELIEWFDLDKVKLPLVVRSRKAGDRFWPLGLPEEKKVGKFLTDAKVPQEIRKKVLIVSDSEKIIWLWPVRISEQAKISSETQKILQLQITKKT